MATVSLPCSQETSQSQTITRQQAAELLTDEERGLAIAQAVNRLLLAKGIYTDEEFNALYIMFAVNQQRRPKSQRPGWRARLLSILRSGS